ncbi:amidohydrolase family protein [Streptomyces sp. NBC_01462]|uniref:amidohydrolase family protein n=1 Tax=Streptomyces sp. NBC_01462 TaxID=2903876 RepID=UPI002E36F329|nr:amidohydrolase family protein [Streptomyces sp. NBC_01462]
MIDSHIHLWGAEVAAAPWLAGERTTSIRRPVALGEYAVAAASCGVEGAVVVTAEQSAAETARLVAACSREPLIRGVVGWADLAGDVGAADFTGLAGIRHSVISEESGWLRRPRVRAGIARYARSGLALELLVAARDLGDVLACASDHPSLVIVVDHLGDPGGAGAPWQDRVRALAPYPNVRMKLSGDCVLPAALDVALDAVGPGRLMIGSDWPVSTLRAPLRAELSALVALLGPLSDAEREQVLAGTAADSYGLIA